MSKPHGNGMVLYMDYGDVKLHLIKLHKNKNCGGETEIYIFYIYLPWVHQSGKNSEEFWKDTHCTVAESHIGRVGRIELLEGTLL